MTTEDEVSWSLDEAPQTEKVESRAEQPSPVFSSTQISIVLYHEGGVMTVSLPSGAVRTIGRSSPADVVIPSDALSRTHARFTTQGDEVWVEDLGSTNGTVLNGVRVERSRATEADEIRLGDVRAFVHVAKPTTHVRENIDTHDALQRALTLEVERARAFARPVATIHLRTTSTPLARWLPKLRSVLGRVDRLAPYSPQAVDVVVVEGSEDRALLAARTMIANLARDEVDAFSGIAFFGSSLASADAMLNVARERARSATANAPICASGAELHPPDKTVVHNQRMKEVFALVDKTAPSHVPVLLFGETGTGKEVIARAIHERGPRANKVMRAVNCGAIPPTLIESTLFGHERGAFTGADRAMPGVFEQADGGTVFLDEVAELTPHAQGALLRILDSRTVTRIGSTEEIKLNVRIIAAANRRLDDLVQEGRFRSDLLFRLNAMTIDIPPLRDRKDEVLPLARSFIQEAARATQQETLEMSGEATAMLLAYDWPGNIRELRNCIDRAVMLTSDGTITPEHLSERVRGNAADTKPRAPDIEAEGDISFRARVRRFEVELLLQALQRTAGNQSEAARLLRMPLRTLTSKMKSYGLRGR